MNAVHQVCASAATPSRLTYRGIADALEARGLGRWSDSTVRYWVKRLEQQQLLEPDHTPRVAPLWPAYLLIDLPAITRSAVVSAIRSRDAQAHIENVQGPFGLLVRTTARHPSALEELAATCIAQGARDVQALVVLSAA